ncbi:protein ALP1-like [Aphis craccivora]|uniref:Protein ALP1-like n=1 Tax=Aphis craccivora TaxID=307492 RepID=A0A6G0YAE6_APHCR|nr:protein ALP1-like [Aphis craccivora]
MSIRSFDELLYNLEQNLKCSYCIREPITPAERFCVTLR